jgi:hypothetical protein
MRGDLSETSAADACRELGGRGVTGAFEVDGPDGPGRIVFRDGRLLAAVSPTPRARLGDRLVSAGVLDDGALTDLLGRQAQATVRPRLGALLVAEGLVDDATVQRYVEQQLLDALHEIVGWHFGAFRFVESAPDDVPEVPLALDVDEALAEVARRDREWEELARVVPHLDAIPVAREHPSAVDASLAADERAVFEAVDGDRSVRQLARELGFGELEATRAVRELTLLGVVDVLLPADEVGAALDEAFASLGAHAGVGADADAEADLEFDVHTSRQLEVDEPPAAAVAPPSATDLDDDPGPEPYVLPITDAARPAPEVVAEVVADVVAEVELPPAEDDTVPDAVEVEAEVDDLADAPVAAPTPTPTPQPVAGGDVSEFLRELSRLAFDDQPTDDHDTRPRPRTDEPTERPAAADDRKKKRRGLFGLGG